MKGRTWDQIDKDRHLRHALEIRHESFADRKFIALLRKHNVALVAADTAGKWPMLFDVTADFVYARLHGAEALYASGYTDDALDDWAEAVHAWSAGRDAPILPASARRPRSRSAIAPARRIGPAARKRRRRDVFVYFDNDIKVRAPFDAARLAFKLGVRQKPLEDEDQTGKEPPAAGWRASRSAE
jgi:uncharacterized protein YecE (DUF72 family)